jgi:hypothetical protein
LAGALAGAFAGQHLGREAVEPLTKAWTRTDAHDLISHSSPAAFKTEGAIQTYLDSLSKAHPGKPKVKFVESLGGATPGALHKGYASSLYDKIFQIPKVREHVPDDFLNVIKNLRKNDAAILGTPGLLTSPGILAHEMGHAVRPGFLGRVIRGASVLSRKPAVNTAVPLGLLLAGAIKSEPYEGKVSPLVYAAPAASLGLGAITQLEEMRANLAGHKVYQKAFGEKIPNFWKHVVKPQQRVYAKSGLLRALPYALGAGVLTAAGAGWAHRKRKKLQNSRSDANV